MIAAVFAAVVAVVVASRHGVTRSFAERHVAITDSGWRVALGMAIGGALATALVAGWVAAQRSRGGNPPATSSWVCAVAVIVMLCAAAAAATAPGSPERLPASAERQASEPEESASADTALSGVAPDRPPETSGSWIVVVVLIFLTLMVAAAAGLVIVVWRLRSARDHDRSAAAAARAGTTGAASELDQLAVAGTLADTGRLLLADPDPRRAIIAAYAALLAGLAGAGSPRLAFEAPEEHLDRSVQHLALPADSLQAVTRLFLIARFSNNPLGEADRQEALRSLAAAEVILRDRMVVGATP